jgi:uncharacterized protein (TIGR03086 family)
MTDTADRYRRLAAAFTEKVAAVPDDAWDNPSPCEEWTARDIVAHVAGHAGTFLGFAGRQGPSLPPIEESPLATWQAGRDALQAALEDPEVAGAEYDSPFGRTTLERSVSQFACADLVVHNWDLSRATGQDERLDADDVHALFEAMKPMDEVMRRPGVFGPKVEPPPGADEQVQLLCFLGRRP